MDVRPGSSIISQQLIKLPAFQTIAEQHGRDEGDFAILLERGTDLMADDIPAFLSGWLNSTPPRAFFDLTRGVEVEFSRIGDDLTLSNKSHPEGLVDPLLSSYITTDMLESTIELITPPDTDLNKTLNYLSDLYSKASKELDNERLWPLSSPPHFDSLGMENVSKYDLSEEGKWRLSYYKDLAERYHIVKAAFTGTHVNYSFSEEFWVYLRRANNDNRTERELRSSVYLAMIRNYHRIAPLVVYLFGCSPLKPHNQALYSESENISISSIQYEISMRNSQYGFWDNEFFRSLNINDFECYIKELEELLSSESNDLLALSELYSAIRAKHSGDRRKKIDAMKRDGIQYVELRNIDLNPFVEAGICEEQIRLLDLVMLKCVLSYSEVADFAEKARWRKNMDTISLHGRFGKCRLATSLGEMDFLSWAKSQMNELEQLACWVDSIMGNETYQSVIAQFIPCFEDSKLTLINRWYTAVDRVGGQSQLVRDLLQNRNKEHSV